MTKAEKAISKLAQKYKTPKQVQKFLRAQNYNREEGGETLRAAFQSLSVKKMHCLEAALLAAAIMEKNGYPPLVMSLESHDDLDHVIFIFKEKGRWGSIARSRMEGLHGRKPVFKTLKSLALSYYDPFIDSTGKVTGFGVANLDDSRAPWRDSPKNVWKVEDFLIDLKHTTLKVNPSRYKRWFKYFQKTGESGVKKPYWW